MAAVAAAAAADVSSEAGERPGMSLVSKRLRALRKKHKRILQMEAALADGKPLNREQSDVLRSKPVVEALIDEYERLRAPLACALEAEFEEKPPSSDKPAADLEDLLALIYVGTLFDVKRQWDFTATMLARVHERSCCLTYDSMPDDDDSEGSGGAVDMLGEADLNALSTLGALVASRPMRSGASHKVALHDCLHHAQLWLSCSDEAIHSESPFTYAGLRRRLEKILASEYFTRTPEIKGGEDLAAAMGKYATSCPIQTDTASPPTVNEFIATPVQAEGDPAIYESKEDESEVDQEEEAPSDAADEAAILDNEEVIDPCDDGADDQNEQNNVAADAQEGNQKGDELEEQPVPQKASYQSQRGSGRGGGRRGYYQNGRGGRGGRSGGFQNCRNQHYDSGYYDSGYHPRNYYSRRGRGGRSGGSAMYNNNGGRGPANSDVGM